MTNPTPSPDALIRELRDALQHSRYCHTGTGLHPCDCGVTQLLARADAHLASTAHVSVTVTEPHARESANAALCDFATRWTLDGDYLRCQSCKRPQIATCAHMEFPHASGCKSLSEPHPWHALLAMLAAAQASEGGEGG